MFLSRLCARLGRVSPGRWFLCLAVIGIGAGMRTDAGAQIDRGRMDEMLRSMNRGRAIGQVAVSPDGKRLAWVQGRREEGEILVAPIDDLAKAQRVSAGVRAEPAMPGTPGGMGTRRQGPGILF